MQATIKHAVETLNQSDEENTNEDLSEIDFQKSNLGSGMFSQDDMVTGLSTYTVPTQTTTSTETCSEDMITPRLSGKRPHNKTLYQ